MVNACRLIKAEMLDNKIEKFEGLNIIAVVINKIKQIFEQLGFLQNAIDKRFVIGQLFLLSKDEVKLHVIN